MNYSVCLWSECLSPLTHMKGVEGNEAMISREPVDTPSGKRWVPRLSGNAMRHRMVREPGGLWLVERLGLKGKLTLMQLNYLIHGGNLTDSTGREDTARIAQLQELFPLMRLLGGALPDQILRGSLLSRPGLLVCEENRAHLTPFLPDGFGFPVERLKPAEHYVEAYQYTRGDAAKRPDWYGESTRDVEAKSNLMIFAGQQVIRGACFLHGFDIPHGSELELGCLLHALHLWQCEGGTLGGMASKGHGRLGTHILGGVGDVAGPVERYIAHVDANAEACREWLSRTFAKKMDRATKGRGKKVVEDESDG